MLYGFGHVGRSFADFIKNDPDMEIVRIKTRSKEEVLSEEQPDIIVEAINDAEAAKNLLFEAINNGKDILTCNKELIHRFRDELFSYSDSMGVTIYLDSIVAGAKKGEFKERLTSKNFNEYINLQPFGFRGAGGKETAEAMYGDVKRFIAVNYGIL